jgi:two-component sensor histidine kinase
MVFQSSLRSRLITVLALSLLPAAALAVVESVRTYENVTLLADRSLVSDAVLTAKDAQSAFLEARRTIQTLAVFPNIMSSDRAACEDTLRGIRDQDEQYNRLMVIRKDGTPVCAFPDIRPGRTFENSPFLASMNAAPRFMVTPPLSDGETGEQIVGMLTPARDSDGTHIGHVMASLRVEHLKALLNAEAKQPVGTFVAIVNGDGELLAEKNVAEDGTTVAIPDPRTLSRNMRNDISFFSAEDKTGSALNYALAPIMKDDVYLLIGTAENNWRSGMAWGFFIAILAPLAMYVLALGVAWYAVDRLVLRHIDQLRRVVDLVERGRSSTRANLPVNAPGEIEVLAHNMNEMLDAIDERETELEAALAEQKILTKEVYHRVKNNLQIISSLMSLQVRNAESEDSRRALLTARKRILAMSTVHEQLYREEGVASVQLDTLIRDIAHTVQSGLGSPAESLPVTFNISPITTNPDRSIPLALLVTEAITNALEYSSGTSNSDPITVSLTAEGQDQLRLTIINSTHSDRPHAADGLGTNLIRVLARQLRGTLTITQEDKYCVDLVFPNETGTA